jgi:hypothetical protein
MGRNRKMANPESYPVAFLNVIRDGGGVLYAEDLPWTTISAAKRFRLCLAVIRALPAHPLRGQALKRWHCNPTSRALTLSTGPAKIDTAMNRLLVGRALSANPMAEAALEILAEKP